MMLITTHKTPPKVLTSLYVRILDGVNFYFNQTDYRYVINLQIGFPIEENFSSYSVIIFPSFKTGS